MSRLILLPLNNGINGHRSVKDDDLQEKQPQKCDSHCACPHCNIWRAHRTKMRPNICCSFFFFFLRCWVLNCTLSVFIFAANLFFLTYKDVYKCFKLCKINISVSDHGGLQAYQTGCCGVSCWFFCFVCDSQSRCKMASPSLPRWSQPQRCDHDVSSFSHYCIVVWTCGLLMLTSSWPPGDPSSSHPPYTPAGSNLVSLLTDGQEGPETPTNIHPPFLKVEGRGQEQNLYPYTHMCV